jgi:hypothetical protein
MPRALPRIARDLVQWKRKPDGRVKRAHLDFVRSLQICIACGREGPVHAAHVRLNNAEHGTFNTMGRKPDDKFALPACAQCHLVDQHSAEGEPEFWARLGIDPLDTALRLFAVTGDREQGLRTILRARQAIALHAQQNRPTTSDGGE